MNAQDERPVTRPLNTGYTLVDLKQVERFLCVSHGASEHYYERRAYEEVAAYLGIDTAQWSHW